MGRRLAQQGASNSGQPGVEMYMVITTSADRVNAERDLLTASTKDARLATSMGIQGNTN